MIIAIVAADICSTKKSFSVHNKTASEEVGSVIPSRSKHSSNV